MPLRLRDHAPQVRCYECGATDIRWVCHRCARPMCTQHGPAAVRERPSASSPGPTGAGVPAGPARPGASADPGDEEPAEAAARPAGREFAGLKLSPVRAAVYYCEEHDRAGIPVIDTVSKMFRRPNLDEEPPPLPVFPDIHNVTIVERLAGEVRLTDAGYASVPQAVEGTIVVRMTHGQLRWQETMGRYRRRHKLREDYPVKFAAGFALLRGKVGLTFDPGQEVLLPDGLGLGLYGAVDGHDLFAAKRGHPQGECELTLRYRLQPERAPRDIPLWIVPSLGATSDRRVLMIDLHWNMPEEEDGSRAELDQFELIEFQVPHQWGNLLSSSPSGAATSAPAPGQPRVVRWRQYRPAVDESRRRSKSAAAGRSITLKLEFEKPILDQPHLSGELRATFDRTLSGVTGMDFYLPGGGPDRRLEVKPRTEISVGFDVSLSGLRYQERRAVPDDSEANGEDAHRPRFDHFPMVMPDHRTVIELTNAISADGYYVKTVVEDHPDPNRSGRTSKRGWDITGRWYEGVFPIDFIISLRGTQPEDSVAGMVPSRTTAEVSVNGTFPNAEMKKKIEDKWDGLHTRVRELLSARADLFGNPGNSVIHGVPSPPIEIAPPSSQLAIGKPDAQAPAPPAGPRAAEPRAAEPRAAGPRAGEPRAAGPRAGDLVVTGTVIPDQAEVEAELKGQSEALIESDDISERTCEESLADVESERLFLKRPDALFSGPPERVDEVNGLLRQRRRLRGALIAGKRSEDFYRKQVARINAELRDLGWSQ